MGFTTIDFIILVAYLAAVLFAGLHFSKKDMQGKELCVWIGWFFIV